MPLDFLNPSVTIAGVPCYEEGPEEEITRQGGSFTRILVCEWASRITVATALIGGSTQNGVIQTLTGAARYPDATWAQADAIRIEGEGILSPGARGMAAWQWARLHVHYGTSDLQLLSEDIGTLSIDVSSQIIQPSQAEPTFKWKSDNKDLPVEATPGVPIPIVDFIKARRNLAKIDMALILSLVDHVNSTTFEGAAPGKVLYFAPHSEARITAGGVYNFDLAHRFQYHPYGHNKFLRPSTGVWEDIVTKNGANPPHPSGDLNALFTP